MAQHEKNIVLIPAYNEEGAIGELLTEIAAAAPELEILVINDCSQDATSAIARRHGAHVIDLPCNLGIGGAIQAGFRFAYDRGYTYAVRCDGDGQHPASEIPTLLDAARRTEADLVVGSRFKSVDSYTSTRVRALGIRGLSFMLSVICRKTVTDPTSGFHVYKRPLLYYFSRRYPTDYPEPEALALLRRQGYDFDEVAVNFRARQAGVSSIDNWGTLYYALKVGMALVVDRARSVDPRYARAACLEAS